jgi:predicted GIY-YIG superfamily endonuclease
MRLKNFYVYILASNIGGTLYIGVTTISSVGSRSIV